MQLLAWSVLMTMLLHKALQKRWQQDRLFYWVNEASGETMPHIDDAARHGSSLTMHMSLAT